MLYWLDKGLLSSLVEVFITRVTTVPRFTSLNMYVVAVLATIQIVV